MPSICGFEIIHRIIGHDPKAGIQIFSMLNNIITVHRALKAGAIEFISKQNWIEELIHAVRQVSLRKTYMEFDLSTALAIYVTGKDNYEKPF